jgi:hypothetical protein
MQKNRLIVNLFCVIGFLLISMELLACGPVAQPVTSVTASVVATPAPIHDILSPIPSAATAAASTLPPETVAQTNTATLTNTTTTPSTPASPTPAGPAEVTITANKYSEQFPDRVTFSIEGKSVLPLKKITLEYGTDEHSVVSETTKVQVDFNAGASINTSYTWEMKKSGSLPPLAKIWYRWIIADEADRVFSTPVQNAVFEDTRYRWQSETGEDMDIYWHDQDPTMIKDLKAGIKTKLSSVKIDVEIPKERKIKLVVYRNYDEVKNAGLFHQEWTGALAYPKYNIVLVPVNTTILTWAQGALAHEITHLRVGEAVFGPFGDIPTWLNEGIAQYAEGPLLTNERETLEKAFANNSLITIRSLSGSFPTDSNQAHLAYVESASFTAYLINIFGWEKINQLLAIFKDGSTYDKAMLKVYGADTNALDQQWRTWYKKH